MTWRSQIKRTAPAGQGACSLSANVIMASTTLIKDTAACTGILHLLLLGLLLPSVLVSGQETTTTNTTTNTTTMTSGATATPTTTQTPTTSKSTGNITQPSTSGATTTLTTTQSPSTASNTATPMAMSAITTTSGGTTSASTAMNQSSSNMTTSGSMTSMMTSLPSNSTGMPDINATMMIYCRSFTCNYSDCYTMYISQNATLCAAGWRYCQLIRQTDMWYAVSCSASCADSCVNASQTNCSVKCCNSTGCLNSTFQSMMVTPTAIPTTTTKATSTSPPTTNGNKCHKGTCTGTTCYSTFVSGTPEMCNSSQPHCQLKKETVDSNLQWTASCATNCSGQTPCKTATQPPCHLECCNATTTSCLWLNGTLHVPNVATRGPHYHTELIASLLCLLAITLLM